jgi:hypothetical protein
VWAGMWEKQMTGPNVLNNHVTGQKHLAVLKKILMLFLDNAVLAKWMIIVFEQDSSPLHISLSDNRLIF